MTEYWSWPPISITSRVEHGLSRPPRRMQVQSTRGPKFEDDGHMQNPTIKVPTNITHLISYRSFPVSYPLTRVIVASDRTHSITFLNYITQVTLAHT